MQGAPHDVVVDGRALAVEPRAEQGAAAAGRRTQREPVELRESLRAGTRQQQVAQELDAGARGLLLARDGPATRQRGRQRRDGPHRVRALVRHVAGQPCRRANVEMRRVVGDGARPDGGRHRAGRSRHHRHRLAEAELRPGSGGQRAEHRVGAEQRGELIAPQPGQAQQVVVVADPRRVARIGHPVQRCGDARRREPAGELEPQPVDPLQEPQGGAVYLRTLGAQPEDVPDWVPPRQRRRAARAPHPERELAGVIARDAQPAAGEPPHVGRAAGVQPDDRGAQRQPCRVDRHGPSPLRGDRDGAHRVALGRAVRQHAAGGGHRRRPPVARALLGAPARLQQQRNALERGRDDLAFAAHPPTFAPLVPRSIARTQRTRASSRVRAGDGRRPRGRWIGRRYPSGHLDLGGV